MITLYFMSINYFGCNICLSTEQSDLRDCAIKCPEQNDFRYNNNKQRILDSHSNFQRRIIIMQSINQLINQ